MRKVVFVLALLLPGIALAGSQTYATPGTYTFTVPSYGTLTVEVWGAGGSGATNAVNSYTPRACNSPIIDMGGGERWIAGCDGGSSSFDGIGATGGQGGPVSTGSDGVSSVAPIPGSGSGGDTNATGGVDVLNTSSGIYVYDGGAGANGGAGGAGSWCISGTTANCANYAGVDLRAQPGQSPGGGGGANCGSLPCHAGAGGGYSKKSYTQGQLSPGSTVTIVVGAGGAAQDFGYTGWNSGTYGYWYWNTGAGGNGKVIIAWTDPCPISLSTNDGGYGFALFANTVLRRLNIFSTNVCIKNTGANSYFIPAKTQAEFTSFLNAISRLSGVTTE